VDEYTTILTLNERENVAEEETILQTLWIPLPTNFINMYTRIKQKVIKYKRKGALSEDSYSTAIICLRLYADPFRLFHETIDKELKHLEVLD